MRVPNTYIELYALVQRSGLKTDDYIKALAVQEEWESGVNALRRTSLESRAGIVEFIRSRDDLSLEMSSKEICAQAGYPANRGNTIFARHQMKQLLT